MAIFATSACMCWTYSGFQGRGSLGCWTFGSEIRTSQMCLPTPFFASRIRLLRLPGGRGRVRGTAHKNAHRRRGWVPLPDDTIMVIVSVSTQPTPSSPPVPPPSAEATSEAETAKQWTITYRIWFGVNAALLLALAVVVSLPTDAHRAGAATVQRPQPRPSKTPRVLPGAKHRASGTRPSTSRSLFFRPPPPPPADRDIRSPLAGGAPSLCANFKHVEVYNIHIPKAAGSSSECTLDDHKSSWPAPLQQVHAARPYVSFSQIGNHATYQDFMTGVPRISDREKPIVRGCDGDIWPPGGAGCQRDTLARRHVGSNWMRLPAERVCTPLIAFMQHPTERFMSAFFQKFGQRDERGAVCGMLSCRPSSEVAHRYIKGTITPDEIARWLPLVDVSGGFNEATRMIGSRHSHRYVRTPEMLRPVLNDSNGRAMLALARRRLQSLDFVGLASRFTDSMTLLSWWLGLPPLNITCATSEPILAMLESHLFCEHHPCKPFCERRVSARRRRATAVGARAHRP